MKNDHGMIMTPAHCDYSDLTVFGKVTIERESTGRVIVHVEGFEFDGTYTCRQHSVKAATWARDALDTAIQMGVD